MVLHGPVLLSGFEPFGGESINPSWEAVRDLDGTVLEGCPIHGLNLPVAYAAALPTLQEAIQRLNPVLVVAVGQASGISGIALERVALNLQDARIPDNDGYQPVDLPVVPDGPFAYPTTLPVKAILQALQSKGIPAHLSLSAGTFLCNHVFYGLQHLLAGQNPGCRSGFIHLPLLPSQAARHAAAPSMALAQATEALRTIIQVSLVQDRDLAVPGGTLHGATSSAPNA